MAQFYVLRPTQALLEWLAQRDVPQWMRLDHPHVWSQLGVGDHDYVGQEENAQTFLKLAVLANFQAQLAFIGRRVRSVGEWWEDAIRDREEHAPCLQAAVSWVLERLAEKTPHRVCALRTLPFSLDARVEDVLHVPGWTLRNRGHDLREGIRLTLEDFEPYSEDVWSFTYRVFAGERRAVLKGTASLQLEKKQDGWTVRSGTVDP
jgi:hypothetical protein